MTDTGRQQLREDTERRVGEAAAAGAAAVASGGHDHILGPGARHRRCDAGDLGGAYHRAVAELASADGHADHVDEIGARDRHAAPAAQQVTGGAHGRDRDRCGRSDGVFATGTYYGGQAAADDRQRSRQGHRFLLRSIRSATLRGEEKKPAKWVPPQPVSRFAPPPAAWAIRTTSRLGVHCI